nr:hypothetical protein [Tanacetum cinerariifolium]
MFSIRIHHGGKFLSYPGRMHVSGRVDIFDMVDIDLFTVVALNIMVLKLGYTGESEPMFYNYLTPLTSLDVGLYALACEEDVRCLLILVWSFKLIEVYIEHGVTVLDSYLRAPQFRATLEDIINEPAGRFADVVGSGVDSSGLSHDESFGVDDLELNLNEPVNLNVSQVETQSELPASEEPDVGPTQELILAEVNTQEPIMAEVNTQEPIVAEVSTEAPIMEEFSKDAGTDDDDDADEDFLVDEENAIVEPDVDVHLFVPNDVLEGEDVDVINADVFDSDFGNDEERSYIKRRIKARCERKVHVFTMSQGTRPIGPYSGMKARPSGSSGLTNRCKKRKNTRTNDDSQASPSFLDAHDKGDLCLWVLYVGKDKFTQDWVMKTHKDTHTCLQSKEIKQYTYKFLSEKIFEQVRVNPDIPVKAVQYML